MSEPQTKPRKRDITRAHVIRAAIACIYREGFHAAHTNKIAEEAGVSWGVLQYHFADKDGLMQAVLDTIFDDFTRQFATANLAHSDIRKRIEHLVDLVWSLVSRPEYRVSVAILRNSGRSADSKVDGSSQVNAWARDIARVWDETFADLELEPVQSHSTRRLMFATLRGLADDLNPTGRGHKKALREARAALVESIHHLLT
jgi:AcrR family transcriptional regulator